MNIKDTCLDKAGLAILWNNIVTMIDSKSGITPLTSGVLSSYDKKENACWFTTDDGKFYVDAKDGSGTLTRFLLNAGKADQLATARTFQIADNDATNKGPTASFDGTSNVIINLPSTIKSSIIGTASGNLPHFFLNNSTISSHIGLAPSRATSGWYHIRGNDTTVLPTTNHGSVLLENDIGTQYQIFFPDTSLYMYKRYSESGAWNTWQKMSAGYADNAGYAGGAGKLTGTSIGDLIWTGDYLLRSSNRPNASLHFGTSSLFQYRNNNLYALLDSNNCTDYIPSYRTYNNSKVYYYKFGGNQDLNWKKVASMVYTGSNSYMGSTIKGIIHHYTGNFDQAEVRDYRFQVNNTFTGNGNIADQCIFRTDPGCQEIIRVVKVGTNNYELQVRQPADWNVIAVQFAVSSIGLVTPCEPVNSSNSSAITTNILNDSHSYIATKLATSRTVRTNLASTSTASFDGSGNITPGVTGTLPVANGGTGATTFTSGAALIGNGTGAISTRSITNMTSQGHVVYNTNLMTTNTLVYWNGSYAANGASNLKYCSQGQFGAAATYGVTSSVTSGSTALITSGAVYSGLEKKLDKTGGTMTGAINFNGAGQNKICIGNKDAAPTVGGDLTNLVIDSWYGISFTTSCGGQTYTNKTAIGFDCRAGIIRAASVYGAVWNDYAEFRQGRKEYRPGTCVIEVGDDTLIESTERLQGGALIVSDTFGFAIGETDEAKTPIATSGRVLAYTFEPRETYLPGDPVCSGPNGTVSKMTEQEVMMYPHKMIGTVSAIPDYEEWGTGKVKVDGRIWIQIR